MQNGKHLRSFEDDTVQLEIFECGCGFHIGLDATYLDQVSEIILACPSCDEQIDTEFIPMNDNQSDKVDKVDLINDLWAAIENGTLDKNFSDLRARVRSVNDE